LIQVLTINPTNANTPRRVDRIRAFIVAANRSLLDQLGQSISCLDPARPYCTLFIEARLIRFWSVNAIELICIAKYQGVSVRDDCITGPTWATYHQK
jgi:hypothetical protein